MSVGLEALMLDSLKDLLRPRFVVDPVFGKLRYLRKSRMWEGRILLPSLGSEIEVFLRGSPEAPNDRQRQWIQQLSAKAPALVADVMRQILTSAENAADQDTKLRLIAVDLTSMIDEQAGWVLTFTGEQTGREVDVEMQGWSARRVDGGL
jgi:hypothetical protein